MKLTRPLLRAAVGLLAGLAIAAPSTAQNRTPGYLTFEGLKDEIGLTVSWLKTQQDPQTGSYGGWKETVWALKIFAQSPWHHGYDDGPFISRAVDILVGMQQPTGFIHEPGADRANVRFQTVACGEALSFFAAQPQVAAVVKRAREVEPWKIQASWEATFEGIPDDKLLMMAEDKLASREPGGYWDHKFGRVVITGRHTEFLCGVHEVIEARHAKRMTPDPARGQAQVASGLSAADRGVAQKALARGASYLVGQSPEGRWGFPEQPDPGITAMVAGALLSAPRDAKAGEALNAALDWLVSLQHEDGSIHSGQYVNYVTSASILALVEAGREKDVPVIEKARVFLQTLQFDDPEGYSEDSHHYGGIGYGSSQRPDLSNTQMALDALVKAGVEPGDPTLRKALEFLQRCQNRSESNDVVLAEEGATVKSGDDGGAGYAPGESKAGMMTLADGTQVPRSYGSMTYALLKGYLLAGLPKDDPRVEAAWRWLTKNYTLDVNPGFEASSDPAASYQGLFYYFHTMARALDLYGTEVVEDAGGTKHAWRSELVGRLATMQRQDGSWVNENAERWYEGNPVLATAYAMMALDEATPDGAFPTPTAPAAGSDGK